MAEKQTDENKNEEELSFYANPERNNLIQLNSLTKLIS